MPESLKDKNAFLKSREYLAGYFVLPKFDEFHAKRKNKLTKKMYKICRCHHDPTYISLTTSTTLSKSQEINAILYKCHIK